MAAETSGTRDGDARGQPGGRVHLARDHVGLAGQQQDVVVGEADERERVVVVVGSRVTRRWYAPAPTAPAASGTVSG